MPLPKIIFCETHNDPISGAILLKIAPRLKQLGYEVFYAETPEDSTLDQSMKIMENNELMVRQLRQQLPHLQQQFPNQVIPPDTQKQLSVVLERALADATFYQFYNYLKANDLKYHPIDIPVGDNISKAIEFALAPEGIHARDKRFAEAYLHEKKQVFGVIGFKHAVGMQKEILKKLPRDKANSQFHFVNVYQKPPIDADEIAMRSGEIDYPLGMSLFDANTMTEDQIVDKILQQIAGKSSSQTQKAQESNFPSSNYNPRFLPVAVKEQEANEWDFDNPTAGILILSALIPVVGWSYLFYLLFNAISDCFADNEQNRSLEMT